MTEQESSPSIAVQSDQGYGQSDQRYELSDQRYEAEAHGDGTGPREPQSDLVRWLSSSRPRNESGAIVGWIDSRTGRKSYSYPEICGYFLKMAHYLRASGADGSVDIDRVAGWLTARVDSGCLTSRDHEEKVIYNFDLAIIASGLLSHPSDTFERTGLYLCSLLRDDMASGGIRALSSLSGPVQRQSWSVDGWFHLVKVAQALLLAELRGLAEVGPVLEIIRSAALRYSPIITETLRCRRSPDTNLHGVLYGAEGMWLLGQARQDEELLAAARELVLSVWAFQLPSGAFPQVADPSSHEQSDVLAQVLRLSALLNIKPSTLDDARRCLVNSMSQSAFGTSVIYRPATTDRHENTWCTMFALQALRCQEGHALHWSQLVLPPLPCYTFRLGGCDANCGRQFSG